MVLCAAQLIYRVSGEASLAGGRSLAQADWRPRWSPADCAVAGAGSGAVGEVYRLGWRPVGRTWTGSPNLTRWDDARWPAET